MRYLLILALLIISACKEETAALPDPSPMTEDALSYFCQMQVIGHAGPKGQVHLKGHPAPLFFAQVRDLIAYLKSPERDADILVVYVSDMGSAPSWHQPDEADWIAAKEAHFVVGADVAGGMGAPEIVPFATVFDADAFTAKYGGEVVSLDAIPDDAALGPVDLDEKLEEPT